MIINISKCMNIINTTSGLKHNLQTNIFSSITVINDAVGT